MKAHLIDTILQLPRSRSSAKVRVKYQGHVSQKMVVSGALVFHKHILFVLKFSQKATAAQRWLSKQCSFFLIEDNYGNISILDILWA